MTVTDHADALTSGPNDNLFTLTLSKATASLNLADILLSAGVAGQTALAVNFVHSDANGDGKLGQGESLACKEPPVNVFDASHAGKTFTVSLAVKQANGLLLSVASADWKPN